VGCKGSGNVLSIASDWHSSSAAMLIATRAGHADISVRHQRPRDLAVYGMPQLVVQLPIVFLLCWLFSLSIPYVPPMK
jgi:hypothetical protein